MCARSERSGESRENQFGKQSCRYRSATTIQAEKENSWSEQGAERRAFLDSACMAVTWARRKRAVWWKGCVYDRQHQQEDPRRMEFIRLLSKRLGTRGACPLQAQGGKDGEREARRLQHMYISPSTSPSTPKDILSATKKRPSLSSAASGSRNAIQQRRKGDCWRARTVARGVLPRNLWWRGGCVVEKGQGGKRWKIGKHLERFTTRVKGVPEYGFGRETTRDNTFGKQHE